MKENNSIKTIVISAIVTGIITVLTTLGINYFSSKQNKLTYSTQTSIPFQKDSLNVKILNIDLYNSGDELIENISGLIQFNNEQITDYKIKALPTLSYKETIDKKDFKLSVSSMNPAEKISISFLLSSPLSIDSIPKINFRARGLFAEEKAESDSEKESSPFNKILLIAATISVVISSLSLPFLRKYLKERVNDSVDDDDQHSDEQNKIIAYLCGVHGLTSEINRYLDLKTEVSYWSEADYFGNISWLNKGNVDNEKRLSVLLDMIEYASIAKESQAIVLYNIGKIYKALDNHEKSKEYIDKAKLILPKRIALRLKIDKQLA